MAQHAPPPPNKSTDKAHFNSKLTLSSGEKLPDPSSLPASTWLNDATCWPKLHFPNIYMYLINTPSVFTNESLKAYKSLDAYNYVICGHVQRVLYHPITEKSDYCFLKADVMPSQRQGTKSSFYQAWVCVHKRTAAVFTANCTCMAG